MCTAYCKFSRYQRSTLGRRAFSVAASTVWNSFPHELREETEDFPAVAEDTILHSISVPSALEVIRQLRYINRRFTYLHAYLFISYYVTRPCSMLLIVLYNNNNDDNNNNNTVIRILS